MAARDIVVNEPNRWRLERSGHQGWAQSPEPGAANKYLMISADCHANEPSDYLLRYMDKEFADRLPRIKTDADGTRWLYTEGQRPQKLRSLQLEGEDEVRNKSGATPEDRLRDHKLDGIDAEIIFPNKGLAIWATPDTAFAMSMCRAWNRWAWDVFGEHNDRLSPVACLATGDIEGSIVEAQWAATQGFRALSLPCKPIFGPHDADELHYNKPEMDRLWAVVQETGLPITFHVSTGRDPRAARGDGGAVINYVSHSLSPTMEPLAHLCASGILRRFPGIRFATIEAGIGWLPWALEAMDEAYRKHHFWVHPKLDKLPSEYFRAHGYASFQEDNTGLATIEQFGLESNILWANDYPHHEGTWPHSAQAIERQMGHLREETRAKILGLNAAALFGFA